MRYKLTFADPKRRGPHSRSPVYICGDQDDVDRYIREHLAFVTEVTVTPV